jgi:hypothetical protein
MTERISAQQIFDTVWQRFVVEMAPRAVTHDEHCVYYDAGSGLRCAVGVLMTEDEAIRAQMYDGSVGWLMTKDVLPDRLRPHVRLLQQLQSAHDAGRAPGDPETPADELRTCFSSREERVSLLTRIANIHGLKVPS